MIPDGSVFQVFYHQGIYMVNAGWNWFDEAAPANDRVKVGGIYVVTSKLFVNGIFTESVLVAYFCKRGKVSFPLYV
jgi:hypothetical protein